MPNLLLLSLALKSDKKLPTANSSSRINVNFKIHFLARSLQMTNVKNIQGRFNLIYWRKRSTWRYDVCVSSASQHHPLTNTQAYDAFSFSLSTEYSKQVLLFLSSNKSYQIGQEIGRDGEWARDINVWCWGIYFDRKALCWTTRFFNSGLLK